MNSHVCSNTANSRCIFQGNRAPRRRPLILCIFCVGSNDEFEDTRLRYSKTLEDALLITKDDIWQDVSKRHH